MTPERRTAALRFCLRRFREHMQDHKTSISFSEWDEATYHYEAALRWSTLACRYL